MYQVWAVSELLTMQARSQFTLKSAIDPTLHHDSVHVHAWFGLRHIFTDGLCWSLWCYDCLPCHKALLRSSPDHSLAAGVATNTNTSWLYLSLSKHLGRYCLQSTLGLFAVG